MTTIELCTYFVVVGGGGGGGDGGSDGGGGGCGVDVGVVVIFFRFLVIQGTNFATFV